jgi:hypothetical protein
MRTRLPDSAANWLVPLLAVFAAAIFLLFWLLLGEGGCGPPGNTFRGWIFGASPTALPLISSAIILSLGVRHQWSKSTVGWAVISTVLLAGMLEAVVFIAEYGCS